MDALIKHQTHKKITSCIQDLLYSEDPIHFHFFQWFVSGREGIGTYLVPVLCCPGCLSDVLLRNDHVCLARHVRYIILVHYTSIPLLQLFQAFNRQRWVICWALFHFEIIRALLVHVTRSYFTFHAKS